MHDGWFEAACLASSCIDLIEWKDGWMNELDTEFLEVLSAEEMTSESFCKCLGRQRWSLLRLRLFCCWQWSPLNRLFQILRWFWFQLHDLHVIHDCVLLCHRVELVPEGLGLELFYGSPCIWIWLYVMVSSCRTCTRRTRARVVLWVSLYMNMIVCYGVTV